MAGDVLRMDICAIFEVCASYEHLWLKSATTPSRKPLATILKMMKQLSTEITELLNKKSTTDFLNAARQFVTLLENGDLNKETFYKDSHKALSELYRTALELETVDLIHSGGESGAY